jgi:hypothetical protein
MVYNMYVCVVWCAVVIGYCYVLGQVCFGLPKRVQPTNNTL